MIGTVVGSDLHKNVGLTSAKVPININNISDLYGYVNQFDKNFKPHPVSRELLNEDGTPEEIRIYRLKRCLITLPI